jgi:hypothetical protein
VPPGDSASSPEVTRCSSVPYRAVRNHLGAVGERERLRLGSADSTLPHLWPTVSSWVSPSITARYFSAGPSDSILRYSLDGHPALRSTASGGFRSVLACVQLLPSCPFRRLHTFRFLRPARLRTPLLGYGAPHLSARGTSTLLNNALLSAHFRFADNTSRIVLEIGTCVLHERFRLA